MAEYIDIQPIIDDLDRDIKILNKYRLQAKEDNRPDDRMMYARKIETVKAFNNLLKEQPTADVIEREKIDKAIEEMEQTLYVDSLIFGELIDFKDGKISADDVIEEFNRVTRKEVLEIIKRNVGESK